MCFRKLNLSCYLFSLLLSLAICCQAAGQHPSNITRFEYNNNRVNLGSPDSTNLERMLQPFSSNLMDGERQSYRITNALTLNITTIAPSCGTANGAVFITATGGTAPYLYTTSLGWSQNTGNFPNIFAGTHTFTVTDANGVTTSVPVTLTNTLPRPVLTMVSITQATNCGIPNATITLQTTGGVPPYEYTIDRMNYQSSNVFTNLSTGSWVFWVRDANGCMAGIHSFDILTAFDCDFPYGLSYTVGICEDSTANVDLRMMDPSNAPYQYSINGGPFQPTGIFSNVPIGVNHLIAQGANGERYAVTVSIPQNCGLVLDWVSVDAACHESDGTLTVFPSGGTPPYTYSIDGLNYQSDNVFTGLSVGMYCVTVKDANNSSRSLRTNVYDRCPVATLSTTGETCLQNDGTITATATRGTPPYQYSLDGTNFQTNNVFTGLIAGSYTVTLKDALGFTSAATTSVSYSCFRVVAVPTNVVCGNMNGMITATAMGGTPPYRYSIDGINFYTQSIFAGLSAGTYTVTAKDLNGQVTTTSVTITNSPGPTISVDLTPTSCSLNDGTITITGIGGTAPLQYSIDNINFQLGNVFTNLNPNPYMAAVRDANGCGVATLVGVVISCPNISTTVVNETCGNANGSVTISVTNATAPYQYSIDGVNFQSSPVFSNLASGSYTVTVRDAINHNNTASFVVGNTCPSVTATSVNGTCGTPNGSIHASGSNGTTPYEYSIDGINFQASNIFNGLSADVYTVTIRDAGGATNTTTVTVGNIPGPQIATISTAATCINNDGTITVSANGGVSPFQFSIDGSNYQTSNVFGNRPTGSYTVWIKDANGCVDSDQATVVLANNLSFDHGNNPTICEGDNATFNCTSNGDDFTWIPASSLNNASQLNPTAFPITTTKYYVTANLGVCTKTDSVTVFVNPAPIADAGAGSTICFGKNTQLNGSGGVVYNWSPATYLSDPNIGNPVVINPSTSISYSLRVTDGNNCTSIQPSMVVVTVTPPTKVFAGNDTSIVINQPFVLQAKDINNSGFVQYTWSPSFGLNDNTVQNPIAVLDRDMKYIVTATTQEGCQGMDEINIKVYQGPEIYVPSGFSPNNDGKNDVLKAIPVGIKSFKYFRVYNRWGHVIFSTNNPDIGWDGKIKGIPQDTNTFIWMAEGIDDNGRVVQRKGAITLIR